MRLVGAEIAPSVDRHFDQGSLIERLLNEQDQVIRQLDSLELQIQQVIDAQTTAKPVQPTAD